MKYPNHRAALLTLLTVGVLSGCAVGPDFERPNNSAAISSEFINAQDDAEKNKSLNLWWKRLDDPVMDGYVDQLLSENLDLIQASERVIQARQNLRIAGASFYPTLQGGGDASRSFSPGQTVNGVSQNRSYQTSYGADLSTSWEIDLFGRIRRSQEAAQANFEARQYDQQALTHSLIAELFTRRVSIATNAALTNLAKQNSANRKTLYDLTERRYNLGTGSVDASDVYLAEENLRSVEADVSNFERLLAEESYRFDVLLGLLPGTTSPSKESFPVLPPPRDVAACLPASLLDRRPDLRASELRNKAANANIGVAIADLYPTISLGGSLGFSNDSTNNLFTAENLAGSLLGSITTRLFEGGRLRANIALKESEARELAAAYAENVLNAIREVETALNAEKELNREIKNLKKSVKALRKAEKISRDRYERGIENLQSFLETQQRRYQFEQTYLRKQQDIWNTRISLYLALGGDWTNETVQEGCKEKAKT